MNKEDLRIPKRQQPVTLWVHPEGPVRGTLFLSLQSEQHSGQEQPIEVLNSASPFLVLWREDVDEPRFYNKRSVVRAEHEADPPSDSPEVTCIACRLHMMDGSSLEGRIIEFLPPESRRLFDYVNSEEEHFLRIYTSNSHVCLVNKAYIVQISEIEPKP